MALPLQKRPNDLFVSYGHTDTDRVGPIVDWLRRSAGLKIWYDAASGDASKRTTELLNEGLQSARGALIALSSGWAASTWCRDEHEIALTQRRQDDAYIVVAIRLDNTKIPDWFMVAEVVDLPQLEIRSAARLLRSLIANAPVRYDNDQDVYFAGPWSGRSDAVATTVTSLQSKGWRLVGDSPDNPQFSDSASRIRSIIGTSRGLVGMLTFDPGKPPDNTSPWIPNEIRIAQELGKPYLLLAEDGVQLHEDISSGAFGGAPIHVTKDGPDSSFQQILARFDEELQHHPHSDARSYSFLAASLRNDPADADDLGTVIERASNMNSERGINLKGEHVQSAIIKRIRDAGFVIADVTDDSRNTLIEAGVAMGARTPLHLLCQPPADGSLKTRFMFQDREMNWYQGPVERLGLIYRIGRLYRRRIYQSR